MRRFFTLIFLSAVQENHPPKDAKKFGALGSVSYKSSRKKKFTKAQIWRSHGS